MARHIARRPLLAGEENGSPWVDARRAKHRSILLRALECRAQVYHWNGEFSLAVETARDAVALGPMRETSHQLLMRTLTAAGNVAEALMAYEQCRQVIARELGVAPSPQTRALRDEILQTT